MKPLNFRDLSDKLKVKYMKEWEHKQMARLLTKLKTGQDITVGLICDPSELVED